MGRFGIEVIAGTIEVDRQQKYRIEAVLLAIGLSLDEQHLLCETVGSVGFFRIAIPESFFLERNRRVFGISADCAKSNKLRNSVTPAVLHHLGTHHQVIVEKFAWVGAIGSDAADFPRKMDDHVGLCISVEADNIFGFNEIVFLSTRHEDLGWRFPPEFLHNARSEKTRTTGDEDSFTGPEAHGFVRPQDRSPV